ncbi:MAG: tetratricopeptide repeat protein [Geminicoccaceae bacterium]|nr:tetratricopeptide repeat protein [Geminicoccaceae bacterium]MDW8342505.1 tetratricopeptide repeat protein [Geminicoccaceae bacterium]
MARLRVLLVFLALVLGAAPMRADEAEEAYRRGQALLEAGKLVEAARAFERVLELAERALGPDDPRLAVDLNNLGEVYRRLGRLDEAAQLLQRAIRLDEAAGGRSPALAVSLNNLGLVRLSQGRLAEAETLFNRSLELLERTLGADHPDVARALVNLAQLELRRGEHASARERLERAARIARASLGPRDPTARAIETALAELRGERSVARAETTAPPSTATPPPSAPARASERSRTAPVAAAEGGAPAAAEGAAPSGTFRLHLGSIRDADRLEQEWRRLVARHPQLAALSLQPAQKVEIPGKGTFWRVIAGPLKSRSEAAELCAKIASAGDPCTVLGR